MKNACIEIYSFPHFPPLRPLPIQYTSCPEVFRERGHHQPSLQSRKLNQTQISTCSFSLQSFYSLSLCTRDLVPLEGFFQIHVLLKTVIHTLPVDFTAVSWQMRSVIMQINEFWSRFHGRVLLWLHMLFPASSVFLWPFCCHSSTSPSFLLSLTYFAIPPAIFYTVFLPVPAIHLVLLSCSETLQKELKTGAEGY